MGLSLMRMGWFMVRRRRRGRGGVSKRRGGGGRGGGLLLSRMRIWRGREGRKVAGSRRSVRRMKALMGKETRRRREETTVVLSPLLGGLRD